MTDTDSETETVAEPTRPSAFKIARTGAKLVVSSSVTATVTTLIHQNTAAKGRREEVQIAIGALVLGSMVAAKAATYAGEKIDTFAAQFKEAKAKADAKIAEEAAAAESD